MKSDVSLSPPSKVKMLQITSLAFSFMNLIPQKYTRDGENVNPPLHIENIPPETKSLAVIVEDPDASGQTWVHWLVWNLTPKSEIIEHHANGITGKNDFGNVQYDGPSPPLGKHRYFFKVYALDETLELARGGTKVELEKEMASHIIAYGELVGIYGRGL